MRRVNHYGPARNDDGNIDGDHHAGDHVDGYDNDDNHDNVDHHHRCRWTAVRR